MSIAMSPKEDIYLQQLDAARRQIKEAQALVDCAKMNLAAAKRPRECVLLERIYMDLQTLRTYLGDP